MVGEDSPFSHSATTLSTTPRRRAGAARGSPCDRRAQTRTAGSTNAGMGAATLRCWHLPAIGRRRRPAATPLKSPKHGGVKRGWTQQVGIVKTTLLLAIAVVSTNLHQVLLWAKATGNTDDPLTQMHVPDVAFEEVEPAEGAGGANSPPAI